MILLHRVNNPRFYVIEVYKLTNQSLLEMASAMSIAVLFRYMGFSLGPASVAAIVQGNLKSLLTKKITGSDAEEVMILLHMCTIDA